MIYFSQSSTFLNDFHLHGDLADAWNESQQLPVPHLLGRAGEPHMGEFEEIYRTGAGPSLQPIFDGSFSFSVCCLTIPHSFSLLMFNF